MEINFRRCGHLEASGSNIDAAGNIAVKEGYAKDEGRSRESEIARQGAIQWASLSSNGRYRGVAWREVIPLEDHSVYDQTVSAVGTIPGKD